MLETSVLNGGRAKTYIPGMYGGKFSCKMNWDAGDTNGLLAFQTNALGSSPSVIAFTLSPNGGTNNYTFNGWVSGIKPSAPVGGLVTADCDVTITGTISYS